MTTLREEIAKALPCACGAPSCPAWYQDAVMDALARRLDPETLAGVMEAAQCPFGCACGKDHSPAARRLRLATALIAHITGESQ